MLVGYSGDVVDTGSSKEIDFNFGKCLVRFDVDIAGMGLECHNPVPNTLWILTSDLRDITGEI